MTQETGARRVEMWRRRAMQALCAGYFVFLTVLLLSQDPNRYVPAQGGLQNILTLAMPFAHLLSFAVLSFLVLSVRGMAPWWALMALMAVYGAATEFLQGFVPGRTPDWWDWFQDVLGVAIGAAAWIAATCARRSRRAAIEKREVPAA